jgi:hypothetical protein
MDSNYIEEYNNEEYNNEEDNRTMSNYIEEINIEFYKNIHKTNFMDEFVNLLKEGMHLKNTYEDDKHTNTCIFCIDCTIQIQPNFCLVCGNYTKSISDYNCRIFCNDISHEYKTQKRVNEFIERHIRKNINHCLDCIKNAKNENEINTALQYINILITDIKNNKLIELN